MNPEARLPCRGDVGSDGKSSHPAAVRVAEPADCRGIAEVHVRTWRAAYQHAFAPELLEGLSVDERETQWRQRIEEEAAVWVAQMLGRVVGFASVGPSRTEEGVGELYAIYVLPEAWGSGAAHELMGAVKAWFASEGYSTAMLWVLADNPRARRFYERQGWSAEGMRIEAMHGVEIEDALYRAVISG
jgi:GNAT superfamily N-acetyltransferase